MRAFQLFLCGLAFSAMIAGVDGACAQARVMVEIKNCGAGCTLQQIVIAGEIDRRTYDQFLAIVDVPRPDTSTVYFAPQVRLDVAGGSTEYAMAIGRKLREKRFSTVVSQGDTCTGACVLILAAGVIRVAVYGNVGIAQPNADDDGLALVSPYDARSKRQEVAESMRDYLTQMGLSDQLYLDMLETFSVQYLSVSKMREYGLIGEDPGFADAQRQLRFAH